MIAQKRSRTIQIFLPTGDPAGIRIAEQTTSIIRLIEVPRSDIYDKRDQLLAKGVIAEQGGRFIFQRDYLSPTPSGASCFLLLGSSNGWVDWKTEQGVTLHDHQGRTLESASELVSNTD